MTRRLHLRWIPHIAMVSGLMIAEFVGMYFVSSLVIPNVIVDILAGLLGVAVVAWLVTNEQERIREWIS